MTAGDFLTSAVLEGRLAPGDKDGTARLVAVDQRSGIPPDEAQKIAETLLHGG